MEGDGTADLISTAQLAAAVAATGPFIVGESLLSGLYSGQVAIGLIKDHLLSKLPACTPP